ncbi:MAG: 1-deoxy-D-xylulose-5-phosphate reductoisomerase, partial [Opitutales bacterium]
DAMEAEGTAPAVFNAANEVAVEALMKDRIAYLDIPRIIEQTLTQLPARAPGNLEDILAADAEARRVAESFLS